MRAQFTLTSAESKRLIAKGVAALPSVKKAMQDHRILLLGGTTNAFVAEELLDMRFERKSVYTIGMVTNATTDNSVEEGRVHPFVLTKGVPEPKEAHWKSFLTELAPGDLFIKGANALDHTGLVGILASDGMGGSIGAAYGAIMQRKVEMICPVGLEKLIPSVQDAVSFLAGQTIDTVLGKKIGLIPVLGTTVVTELTALETLFGVKAVCVAAGGVNGSEGAVVLVAEGTEQQIQDVLALVHSIKGEPQVF